MTDDARGRKLLAIYAHPDDESFGSGGMLAKYAAEGASVGLVCATNGEMGEISDPDLASSDTLGDVRIAELKCAAEALGVTELVLLGYRDSGMAETADNEDPRAFANAPDDEIVARLVGIIRRVRPDVVVTFDPTGGYGHPDHVAVHNRTVAAFHPDTTVGRIGMRARLGSPIVSSTPSSRDPPSSTFARNSRRREWTLASSRVGRRS